MNFIDTHCHLYLEQFDEDIQEVVVRALQAGITHFLLPNIDSESISPMNQLVEKYPQAMFPMMGLHPTNVKENYKDELQRVEYELNTKPFIAVGEIGIDLYWDKTYLDFQREALDFQINLALKHHLPVVIHSRDSHDEIMDIIRPYKNSGLKGVFHCFSGNNIQAKEIIELGFLLGIGGVITFKNSGLAEAIADINLRHIILETDAPYLAPTPHRGKRNESSYIPLVAEKLSNIKNLPVNEIARITTENAIKLFKI